MRKYGYKHTYEISTDYTQKDAWHRVPTTGYPYFNLSDVKKIYVVINGGKETGLEQFAQKARKIAIVRRDNVDSIIGYQFVDEEALFSLFKSELAESLNYKGINTWGELMQYIA